MANIGEEIIMSYKTTHPEQDPAEGSREVIDRELARQGQKEKAIDKRGKRPKDGNHPDKARQQDHRPM